MSEATITDAPATTGPASTASVNTGSIGVQTTNVGVVSTDAEWRRVAALLSIAEAERAGELIPDTVREAVVATSGVVRANRDAGSWRGLERILDPALYAELTQLDIDILAVLLAGEAMPMLVPRILALQPYLNTTDPGLPLIQELLLLDQPDEVAMMLSRLAPAPPAGPTSCCRTEPIRRCGRS